MIPRIAHFYWNIETPLSFLRYQTLVTFRKHHPDWQMIIGVSKSDVKKTWTGVEKQDFEETGGINYLMKSEELGVKVVPFLNTKAYAPNYMSDVFRWYALQDGGWYFDLDQIFLKPLDNFCYNMFIFGCTKHAYSGVLGAAPKNQHVREMLLKTANKLKEGVTKYCEAGNWLFSDYIKDKTHAHRTCDNFFYPITDSYDVHKIYSGEFQIPEDSYALHWFGGHPDSQEFNKKFTPESMQTSNDTISRTLRAML